MPEYEWRWNPRPPEMVMAKNTETGLEYHFECVGTVPAGEDDEGDLLRVWVADRSTPFNRHVVDDLEEKHGVYARRTHTRNTGHPLVSELDGFTPGFTDGGSYQ